MSLQNRLIDYQDGDTRFEGRIVWDDSFEGPRPGILVCHTIRGRTDFEDGRADELARLGYAAFAVDLYGKETRGLEIEKYRALMDGLRADRPGLQKRLLIALATLRDQDEVDAARTAAIGYCFGGLCVLDIARTGEDIAGVASFHGIFEAPGNTEGNTIKARVLALHGWDDPLATPDAVNGLAAELSAMGADWQIHAYGNTMHAFTNPAANDPVTGTVYDASANRRSWQAMTNFLEELFGD